MSNQPSSTETLLSHSDSRMNRFLNSFSSLQLGPRSPSPSRHSRSNFVQSDQSDPRNDLHSLHHESDLTQHTTKLPFNLSAITSAFRVNGQAQIPIFHPHTSTRRQPHSKTWVAPRRVEMPKPNVIRQEPLPPPPITMPLPQPRPHLPFPVPPAHPTHTRPASPPKPPARPPKPPALAPKPQTQTPPISVFANQRPPGSNPSAALSPLTINSPKPSSLTPPSRPRPPSTKPPSTPLSATPIKGSTKTASKPTNSTPSSTPSRKPFSPAPSGSNRVAYASDRCHGTTRDGKPCSRRPMKGGTNIGTPTKQSKTSTTALGSEPKLSLSLTSAALDQLDALLRQGHDPDDQTRDGAEEEDPLPRFCHQHFKIAIAESGIFVREGKWVKYQGEFFFLTHVTLQRFTSFHLTLPLWVKLNHISSWWV